MFIGTLSLAASSRKFENHFFSGAQLTATLLDETHSELRHAAVLQTLHIPRIILCTSGHIRTWSLHARCAEPPMTTSVKGVATNGQQLLFGCEDYQMHTAILLKKHRFFPSFRKEEQPDPA